MNIEDSKIYFGDSYIKAVYLGDTKLKYGKKVLKALPVRYIREHQAYSTMPNGQQDIVRTFIEIEAIDVNGDNVARGKSVTVQPGYTVFGGTGNANTLTDGNKTAYYSLSPQDKQPAWVQVDLGQVYEIEAISAWRYPDRRKFKSKVEVSEDGTHWTTVFNSDVDGEYEETNAGKTYILIDPTWQWPKNGFRYVRDYVKGNRDPGYKNEKQWLEIQVLDKNGFNLAQGRPVTQTPGYNYNTGLGEISVITDGNTMLDKPKEYYQILPSDDKWVYVEVDLGKVFKPKEIKRWHYTKANWTYISKVMVSEDGVKWYRVFDTLFDGEYVDTDAGHTITSTYTDPTEYNHNGIRYIRDWLRGSNVDNYKNWVEIFAVDSKGINAALNKPIENTPGYAPSGSVLTEVVDGKLDRQVDIQPPNGNWAYVKIDLGRRYIDLEKLIIWHYYNDGRKYIGRTEVSDDGITWNLLYSTKINGEYPETKDGHTIPIVRTEALIPQFTWFYYSNYTNGMFNTFYTPLTDSDIANAIIKKLQNLLPDGWFGEKVTMQRGDQEGADFVNNTMLIRVDGMEIDPNWASLAQPQKEDKFKEWFDAHVAS